MDGGVTLLSGKKLRPYKKPLKHTIMAGGFAVIDFNAMLLEWVACGVVGIITGLLSVVWDIIVLVKDVVIGVFDLLLFVVCVVSGGSAGSGGWLAVKNFFSALFSAFGHPVKTFDQFWEELKPEVTTIEGLLSDCPQAEFIVRKVVNGIVNLILILAVGHGLVKGSVSLIRGAVEVGELAEQVDTAQALARTGSRVVKAARVRMSSRPLIFV